MNKSILFIMAVGFSGSLLSGCASIVSGTHQEIVLETPPATGATCTLRNNKGEWLVKSTPEIVKVHRSFADLLIRCKKHGYFNAAKKVQSNTKVITAGNAVFGGVLGVGIDAADGAAYAYPQHVRVPMIKK